MRRAQGRRLLQAELSGDKSDDDDTISLSGALPPITGSVSYRHFLFSLPTDQRL